MATLNIATQVDRLSIIASLVRKQPAIGTTALMKCVYLLQEVFEVPLGYDYTIYTYGPYSSQVTSDVDLSIIGNFISYKYESTGDYVKRTFNNGERIDDLDFTFADNYSSSIDQVINDFANKTASELELIATIIYVYIFYKRNGLDINKSSIANDVHGIKPHFSTNRVESEYTNLSSQKLLK
ncbi:MAG: hypothetical protein FWE45_00560 [Firmicutes bacterium]|nr:hypothetical protein [Bacillota bacterium]